mmetsp:Transcript_67476/g.177926  ORF Transcript_67476/g.177926 Transcript_67476/m.177926 type:complete len:115 (-) Transcript_67476:78-422(-)
MSDDSAVRRGDPDASENPEEAVIADNGVYSACGATFHMDTLLKMDATGASPTSRAGMPQSGPSPPPRCRRSLACWASKWQQPHSNAHITSTSPRATSRPRLARRDWGRMCALCR